MARPKVDMVGRAWQNGMPLDDPKFRKYGNGPVLTCLGPARSERPGYWLFQCSCGGKGSKFEARGAAVRCGNTRSCGCMKRGPSSKPSDTTPKKRKPRKLFTYAELREAGGDLIPNALVPLFEERGVVVTREQDGNRVNTKGQSVPQWQYWYAVQPNISKRIGPFEHMYNLIGHIMLHAIGRVVSKNTKPLDDENILSKRAEIIPSKGSSYH